MNDRTMTILVAEDDPDDRLLLRDALAEAGRPVECAFVNDGEELLVYLRCCDPGHESVSPLPGIIILDLNMPRKDGREALREIKSDPRLRHIPIIVLTTSRLEHDIVTAYRLGVNSFIRKPLRYRELVTLIRTLCTYWFDIVNLPLKERSDP